MTGTIGGEVPDWYKLDMAAKRYGVPPWLMETIPTYWRERALAAEEAEAYARSYFEKRRHMDSGR